MKPQILDKRTKRLIGEFGKDFLSEEKAITRGEKKMERKIKGGKGCDKRRSC